MKRITNAQIAPARAKIAESQGHICPLCKSSMKGAKGKKPALDHCHTTGRLRGGLCLNCNGMEGKIHNLARRGLKGNPKEFLQNLLAYWEHYEENPREYLHPTHKTESEKRLARNKKARERRAKLKG